MDSGKQFFLILSHDSSLSSLSLFSNASLWLPPFPLPAVPSLSSVLPPVSVCFPVCVEVPSETEAVQGNPMKLRCISCMKREEVEATTVVEWFYRPEGGKDFLVCQTAGSGLSFAGRAAVCLASDSLQDKDLTLTGSFSSEY